ncbi:MAG: sulfite exporter TauE/SafE family protein, partial [Bdellovibrionales bacterium]
MVITPDIFTILSLGTLGMLAGGIGALVGVGGGIFIVPALILFFGIDIKYAVAASLLAVVATSTAAGSVYVGRGLTNMRLGMTLEVSTTLGGIAGSFLVLWISQSLLLLCFSLLLSVVAFLTLRSKETARVAANEATPESPSTNLQVDNKVSVNAVATETTHK